MDIIILKVAQVVSFGALLVVLLCGAAGALYMGLEYGVRPILKWFKLWRDLLGYLSWKYGQRKSRPGIEALLAEIISLTDKEQAEDMGLGMPADRFRVIREKAEAFKKGAK